VTEASVSLTLCWEATKSPRRQNSGIAGGEQMFGASSYQLGRPAHALRTDRLTLTGVLGLRMTVAVAVEWRWLVSSG